MPSRRMSKIKSDEQARKDAIDPSRSFIVQAPAGSGKTELITQRFLKLLSHVKESPEEIIAITFTRKAAAEMRQRIIDALNYAAINPIPKTSHKQLTWKLASNALERDKALHWELRNNPNRLRIFTIDALSAYLVKHMPITAQLPGLLNITDTPLTYYREAAQEILLSIKSNPSWSKAIETLLLHLDNRVYLLENLLIQILSKREQWLPHIINYQENSKILKKHLNTALQNIALDNLTTANTCLTPDILCELIPLADFAGRYCEIHDKENPITQCKNMHELSVDLKSLPLWRAIANLLLTKKGEWRKSITKKQGFPSKGETKEATEILKLTKQQMTSLLKSLSNNESLKKTLP